MGGKQVTKEVKNKDLWLELIDLIKNKKINWFWVKGHLYQRVIILLITLLMKE